jgi:hypothetical protein
MERISELERATDHRLALAYATYPALLGAPSGAGILFALVASVRPRHPVLLFYL